jgi:TolB-like protein
MIGDPEQEHFCQRHGENINALSRFKSLFVIARNRSFAHCCAVLSG